MLCLAGSVRGYQSQIYMCITIASSLCLSMPTLLLLCMRMASDCHENTLQTKRRHDANFVVISATVGCRNNNL